MELHALALAASLLFAPAPAAAAATSESLLERARAANDAASWRASGKELLLEGEATVEGLAGPWQLRVAPDGRFALRHDSRRATRSGRDATSTWRVDSSGIPIRTALEAREQSLLTLALWSGSWCEADGPLLVTGEADGALELRARDGLLTARVELDAATARPARLEIGDYRGARVWQWSDWREVAQRFAVPHACELDESGQKSRWTIAAARLVEPLPGAFDFPAARPADTRFDAARPARLDCKVAPTGHLLVRAELDGADHGRWIFDSGAGGMVVDPDVAKKLGYEPFGEVLVGGAGATRTAARFHDGSTLRVGPATLERPHLTGFELDSLSATFGEPLAGIIGYDFFQRVVATVDMQAGRVEIADPATFARADVTWRPLVLHGNHPHVECTFGHDGDETALFRLDTGAASVAVIFHTRYVQEAGLLAGRPTAPFHGLSGVGGETKARIGLVDWFELGGVVVDQPTAIFVEDPRGALADPWSAGTIGGDLLEKHDLVLDYPHGRIGFAPRRAAK
ncbi:MAG: aspartyl protease family protein [Planctomycetes bacterium]|nr:aspartyl protease family protein [Planctomycetota bacterium]